LATALEAVEHFVTKGESFFGPICYITRQICVDVHRALSPLFDLVDFDEIPLLEISDSGLFSIIQETLMMSDDVLLLVSCANLIAACACVSKACLAEFLASGLHDSLFACLPRLHQLDAPKAIVAVLDALTIIQRRLSWVHIHATLNSNHITAVFSIASPLCQATTIPFVRLFYSMLVSGLVEEGQVGRVENGIRNVLYRSFHVSVEEFDPLLLDQLGELAEIAMDLNRSSAANGSIIISNFRLFDGIAPNVHLLSPVTTTRLLAFFDDYAASSDKELTAGFLWKLPCGNLIELLQLDYAPLVETVLNALSLVIERQCIDPNYLVQFIIPKIHGFILETIYGGAFRISRAAIRFVHAIVGKLNWIVLPREAFRVYMTRVTDFMPSEDSNECILFLDCLLRALQLAIPEFTDYVRCVCDELCIWDVFEKIPREDAVVSCLCEKIDEVMGYPKEDWS
jgi:hypothetical protein